MSQLCAEYGDAPFATDVFNGGLQETNSYHLPHYYILAITNYRWQHAQSTPHQHISACQYSDQ